MKKFFINPYIFNLFPILVSVIFCIIQLFSIFTGYLWFIYTFAIVPVYLLLYNFFYNPKQFYFWKTLTLILIEFCCTAIATLYIDDLSAMGSMFVLESIFTFFVGIMLYYISRYKRNVNTIKSKNKKRYLIFNLIILFLFFMAGVMTSDIYEKIPFYKLILLIYFVAFINVNIHEFGHFFLGKILGFRLISYRIGFLAWNNQNGKMVFSFIRNNGYSGLCAMISPYPDLSIHKHILYHSGGIIMNFLTAGIFILPVFILPNMSPFAISFFYLMVEIALISSIINLFPFYSKNNPTDGKVIWSLLFNKKFTDSFLRYNHLAAQMSSGLRPRDLQIQNDFGNTKIMPYDYILLLYLYYKSLDENKIYEAINYADQIEEIIDCFSPTILTGAFYELCYIGCITGNMEKAQNYYSKAHKMLKKDYDINGLRVKAAYEYFINRNKTKAYEYCEKALSVADKFPIKGQSIMEKSLVEKIKEL